MHYPNSNSGTIRSSTPLFPKEIGLTGLSGVNFHQQQRRLIAHLRELVRNGDATERSLARLTGVSQPHMHNVLKGKRLLSLEMADQVLAQLHLDVLDFIEPGELMEWQRRR